MSVVFLNSTSRISLHSVSVRKAGDFSDVVGEREMAPKCGSLPRDARDLVGLQDNGRQPLQIRINYHHHEKQNHSHSC